MAVERKKCTSTQLATIQTGISWNQGRGRATAATAANAAIAANAATATATATAADFELLYLWIFFENGPKKKLFFWVRQLKPNYWHYGHYGVSTRAWSNPQFLSFQ